MFEICTNVMFGIYLQATSATSEEVRKIRLEIMIEISSELRFEVSSV